MINSMTGFGQARARSNGISLHVECKSVNNRYLDITLRLPSILQQKELALKELIQTKVGRGSLNIQVTIDKKESGKPKYAVNKNLAQGYKKLLEELRKAADIEGPVTIRDLTEFDAVFTSRQEDEETVNLFWNLTKQAVEDALVKLNEMRKQEGEQLKQDLIERVDHIELMMKKIKSHTKNRGKELHSRLSSRIQQFVESEKLDEERLEMEIAVLVDKMDITEEIVRLESHIKFFKEALEKEHSVGRRLKFLCQEMNREVNTMGSKANHSEVSQLVVQAKESLEQIREQVLNIE